MIGISDIKKFGSWLQKIIAAPKLLEVAEKEIKRLRARIRKMEKSIK